MISLIVAVSENNVIGRDNDLPWHLPDDMKFFREKTRGHPIILGRKNYESIGRPLPGRRNIVVSRDSSLKIEGCEVVGSVEEAMELASEGEADEVFVIGGGQIYKQAFKLADRIYLTRVHAEIEGDVFFPEIDPEEWELVSQKDHEVDEQHAYGFTFEEYRRRNEEVGKRKEERGNRKEE
mgnify:CR=1 FL=1